MGKTSIQWTEQTWNPTVGCTRTSPGCKFCYAFALHDKRHAAHKAGKKVPKQYAEPFARVQLMPERLKDPLSWKKPRMVFVNSVSDLFHEDIPFTFIDSMFAVMAFCGQHTFQVLTKRAERMLEYMDSLRTSYDRLENSARALGFTLKFEGLPLVRWPIPNVWLGVSVEDQARADERIPLLLQTPASVRFLSCEPLLGPVDISRWLSPAHGILADFYLRGNRTPGVLRPDWVICGGESGPLARPCHVEWVRDLVRQCQEAEVACFVKQLGSNPYQRLWIGDPLVPIDRPFQFPLRDHKGGDINEFPEDLRIREFPEVR